MTRRINYNEPYDYKQPELEDIKAREGNLMMWLRDLGAIEGKPASKTDKGSEYITFVSGGTKEEGQSCPVFCSTPEKAIELWKAAIPSNPNKQLVVRCWPEIRRKVFYCDEDYRVGHKKWLYTVYSRMVFE